MAMTTEPRGNPVVAARTVMEARIPPAMRADDWDARWRELEEFADVSVEVQRVYGLLRLAFNDGHLTAEGCPVAAQSRNTVGIRSRNDIGTDIAPPSRKARIFRY